MSIPTLDMQSLDASALDTACREWGFFALVGHDVSRELLTAAMAHTRDFFTAPIDAKNRIRRSASNPWGFYDAELTKNRRDWKEILDIGPSLTTAKMADATTQWPDIPGFKTTMSDLQNAMHAVALHLVRAIGNALESHVDLTAPFAEHTSFLRLNFYPTCPDPAAADAGFVPEHGQLGISHHTDAGAVTVLAQDEHPGLQVYRDGSWYLVDPVADAFIINIGDIVQVWSNDRYQAPLHRVLANSNAERISMPYFLNPAYDYDYAPVVADPPHYTPINWGAFREGRTAGDYADQGEEIQISHFRTAQNG